jgi:hypothetical protein
MANHNYNIYRDASEGGKAELIVFFNRVKLLRDDAGLGRTKLINQMRSTGATITVHSLQKYEHGKLPIANTTYLMLFCKYFGRPLRDMFKPLSEHEQARLNNIKEKGKLLAAQFSE